MMRAWLVRFLKRDAVFFDHGIRYGYAETGALGDGPGSGVVVPGAEQLGVHFRVTGAFLENQEIAHGRAQVQVRRGAYRSVRVMRRHGHKVGVRHFRHLAQLGDAAAARGVRLENPQRVHLNELARLKAGLHALAGGERNAGSPLDLTHGGGIAAGNRLFEEQHFERFENLGDGDGRSHVELTVALDADVEIRAALAVALDHLFQLAQGLQADLPVRIQAVEKGIVLAGQRPFGHQLFAPLGVGLAGALDVPAPTVAGVDPDPVAQLSTQQLVDRHAELLSDHVPQCAVDGCDRRLNRGAFARSPPVPYALPDSLDIPGALAHHGLGRALDFGIDGRHIAPARAVAPAGDAVLRLDPAKQKVHVLQLRQGIPLQLQDHGRDALDLERAGVCPGLVQDGVRLRPGPSADGTGAWPHGDGAASQNAGRDGLEKVPPGGRDRVAVAHSLPPSA